MLLEHAEHLVLMRHLGQHAGVLDGGNTQQRAVEVFLQSEEVDVLRIGEQRTVVVIHVVVNLIISGVELPRALQQLHLRHVATLLKHLHRFLGGHLVAQDGVCGIDDLLHALAYLVDILQFDGVANLQVDVETIAHRDVDNHPTALVNVVHRLAENEEQRARVVA